MSAQGVAPFDYAALRREFGGAWIVNNGYTRDMAITAVESSAADAVAFGKPFIANPDLVQRLARGAALNALDTSRLYGGGSAGSVDYPTLEESAAAVG